MAAKIQNAWKGHRAAFIAIVVIFVVGIASAGTALAMNMPAGIEAVASEETHDAYTADPIGVEGLACEAAAPEVIKEVAEEVPEGAEVIEDANAPEGTVAVKDASGNVSYVPAAKAEAAVSSGTASRPSAGTSSSGSTGGGSAATPAPTPEAPKHVCSASVPKTVIDQAAWTETIGKIARICVNKSCSSYGFYFEPNTDKCPYCGSMLAGGRYNDHIEHPAITHTEWYCTCGAKM